MKKILIILAVVISIPVIYLTYSGLFASVVIEETEVGPLTFAYAEHKGDYSKIGPVMDQVYQDLLKDGLETYKGIGVYFDDPQMVKKEDLRSYGGSVIEENDIEKFNKVKDKYKSMTTPKYLSVTAEFPIKTKLSFIIGVIKVYPKIGNYIKEKNYKTIAPPMEIYIENEKTVYVFPISEVK